MTAKDRMTGRPARISAARISAALISALLASSAIVRAQDVAPRQTGIEEDLTGDALTLDPITVVSASTIATTIQDAPASVTVIDSQTLERRGSRDLTEALRIVPGVNVAFGSNGSRGVSIRGFSDQYTLTLIDGKRVNAGQSFMRHFRGDMDWIPVDAIERIEVVRGPMSTLYGSDAMGGVVNIITKRGKEAWGGSITADFQIPDSRQTGDSQSLGAFLSGPVTDKLGMALWGGIGFEQPGEDVARADGGVLQGAMGLDDYDLNTRLTWNPNAANQLELEAGFAQQKYQGTYANTVKRATGSLQHKGQLSFGDLITTAQIEKTDNRNNGETIEFTSMILDSRLGAPLTLGGRAHRLTGGVELRYEEMKDPVNLGQVNPWTGREGSDNPSVTMFAVYGEGQFDVTDRLALTLGARLDDNEDFGAHLSPRVYVNYALTDALMLKAGWSQSFKAPDLRQLDPGWGSVSMGRGCGVVNYGNGCWMVGNPDLDPETSNSYEAGLNFQRGGWLAEVTYFYNDIDDMITVADRSSGWHDYNGVLIPVVERVNIQRARTSGVEAGLTVPLRDTLTWTNSLTWMIESKNLTTGAALAAIPEVSAHTDLGWEALDDLSLYATYDYYGEQVGQNALDIGAYGVAGVSAAYRPTDSLVLRAGISNLFDTQPDSLSGYRETGRTYSVQLTSNF